MHSTRLGILRCSEIRARVSTFASRCEGFAATGAPEPGSKRATYGPGEVDRRPVGRDPLAKGRPARAGPPPGGRTQGVGPDAGRAGRGFGIRPPAARGHAPRDGGAGYLRRLPPEQGLPPGPEAVPADSTRRG